MYSQYFNFIQIAVGNRQSLAVEMTDSCWQQLFAFCKKQALVGVGFSAVEKLHEQGVSCPAPLRMKWYAMALKIEKRNELLNGQCAEITRRYGHDGLKTCILKGQGNLLNYPEKLRMRRQSGDIDVWCVAPLEGLPIAELTGKSNMEYVTYYGRRAVMEYAWMQSRIAGTGDKSAKICYHHIKAPYIDGTSVEIHFRPGYTHSPLRNIRMQRWFERHADECMKNMTQMGFAMPAPSVNVVYQMTHLFSHYFDEGLGLRQLMDYYFTLRVWHNDLMECRDLQAQGMWSDGLGTPVMSVNEVMHVLKSFGMGKFASAVMWVLHEVFAMPALYYICEPNEKEGRRMLAEIMQGGNFGQYDTRGRTWKSGGMIKHGFWKLKRIMRLVGSYPEEALWEPVFRGWHLFWRIAHC